MRDLDETVAEKKRKLIDSARTVLTTFATIAGGIPLTSATIAACARYSDAGSLVAAVSEFLVRIFAWVPPAAIHFALR